MNVFDFDATTITGEKKSLADFRGEVLLIVNTASACGFTPQYQGLQELYQRYQHQGLTVLGFPCNQFGAQESGNEQEIAEFCNLNYKISFPMFGKIAVNGEQAHPLYVWLKDRAPGILGTQAIKWNFTKFLVSRDGTQIKRFAPQVSPAELEPEIQAFLSENRSGK